jgi:D-alanyl-D-alanine dipeptidase
MLIVDSLYALSRDSYAVYQGLNQPPWSMGWFIATGVSSHQMGAAIDVSLGGINEKEMVTVGSYTITIITDYTEHIMPTPIHELSTQAVVFATPTPTADPYGWQQATLAITMTEAGILLQHYLTQAGFTPLASEWWHFDDPQSMNRIRYNASQGDFVLSEIFSHVPK